MKYLQKTWVRVLISLFTGGFVTEIFHITTGDPNRPVANNNSIFVIAIAGITYLLLTSISKKEN